MSTTALAATFALRKSHAGTALRRVKGLVALGGCLVVGVALARLPIRARPPELTLALEVRGAGDDAVRVFASEGREPFATISPRVVLSRTAARFDAERSLVTCPDGTAPRIVPRNAALVLVRADGRVAPLRAPLPWRVLERLIDLARGGKAPSDLAAWFVAPPQEAILEREAPHVLRFWRS